MPHLDSQQALKQDGAIFRPIMKPTRGYATVVCVLLAVIAWAAYAYWWQLRRGLGMTGLNRPVYWGIYITNFVFFVGVSHAGTLISAILRLCRAEWRRSITRMAEMITVLVLFFGVGNVLLDLGRPDRAIYIMLHPHLRSPLLWDVTSVTCYLTASTFYLWLPLIPDIARLRDYTVRMGGWRHKIYTKLAIGWTGTPEHKNRLERNIRRLGM